MWMGFKVCVIWMNNYKCNDDWNIGLRWCPEKMSSLKDQHWKKIVFGSTPKLCYSFIALEFGVFNHQGVVQINCLVTGQVRYLNGTNMSGFQVVVWKLDKKCLCYETICLVKSHSQNVDVKMRASSLLPYLVSIDHVSFIELPCYD